MLHEPSARHIEMASPYLEATGCSSSDHLTHHKRVRSYDPKSRSLDASCASSYTTNDPLIAIANSDNPIANPLVASCKSLLASSCASLYTTNIHLIRAANTDNLAANSSNQEMISPIMDPKDVKMVPFKWEEAPGRPMDTSSSNGLVIFNPSSLQLPPKLQCQSHQSPLRSMPPCQERPLPKKLRQPITHSLPLSPPNKQIFKRLCTYVLKTASRSEHGGHKFASHSWSNPPCIEFSSTTLHQYKQHDKLEFNDRLFFDRHSPKDLRHCDSMNSILPIFDDPDQREDDVVSKKALSFLAMEEHEEAESTTTTTAASSPWLPMSFHEREGSASPWQPVKVCRKLAEEEDDADDDEGFHDLFSTASSSMKPSQRTDDDGMESTCSSPSPWYLDFSPDHEEEVHVERRGSKLIVTLVAMIKLKGVISRKVISKFKRGGEGVNHQLAESTIWSPTLATYLYNEQLEEEKQIKTPISSAIGTTCDDGQSELGSNRLKIDPNYYLPATIRTHLLNPNYHYHQLEEEKQITTPIISSPSGTDSDDRQSEFGSNRLKIDPSYYLPATIRTHSMTTNHYYSDDDENLTPSAAHDQERQDKESSIFTEEEEEESHNLHDSTHRLSLREQLVEFGDENIAPAFREERNRDSRTLEGHPDNHFKARQPPSGCKGMCKVRKTVKLVASTIKLILVQTDLGHKKGAQRSFHSCIKPTVNS